MLKTIKMLRERVENGDAYPFSVPAIGSFNELNLRSRVCLFAGGKRYREVDSARSYRCALWVRARGREPEFRE